MRRRGEKHSNLGIQITTGESIYEIDEKCYIDKILQERNQVAKTPNPAEPNLMTIDESSTLLNDSTQMQQRS